MNRINPPNKVPRLVSERIKTDARDAVLIALMLKNNEVFKGAQRLSWHTDDVGLLTLHQAKLTLKSIKFIVYSLGLFINVFRSSAQLLCNPRGKETCRRKDI